MDYLKLCEKYQKPLLYIFTSLYLSLFSYFPYFFLIALLAFSVIFFIFSGLIFSVLFQFVLVLIIAIKFVNKDIFLKKREGRSNFTNNGKALFNIVREKAMGNNCCVLRSKPCG